MSYKKLTGFFFAAIAVFGFTVANAAPVKFEIIHGNGGGVYSLIHNGSGPSGGGWRHIAGGQGFSGWLDGSSLVADPNQSVLMANGETLTIHSLELKLNGSYGIENTASQVGSLVYSLTNGASVINGLFSFTGLDYTSIFNSASMENGVFTSYLWGGDIQNDMGIDLGIRTVPEPATLFLLGLGLLGLTLGRRRARGTN